MESVREDEIFPYNEKNKILNEDNLMKLLIPYDTDKFYDINFYRRAFIHKSYVTRKNENYETGNINCPNDCMFLQELSNERLEYLGDSILNSSIASYVFERYPDENEGFLTVIRTKLVNGKMLANLAKKLGLSEHLVISKQIDENDGRNNKNVLEDAFEALIGAIYLDNEEMNENGFNVARNWIINFIETHIDFSELIHKNENYKDVLIKYCQHTHQFIPKFYEIDVMERNGKKVHTVAVKNDSDDILGIGKDINRKTAELNASKHALDFYGYFQYNHK